MRLFLLTTLTMIAFAANSVLNRFGVGDKLIDPLSFAMIRLLAGALMLAGLLLLRRGALWPGSKGRVTGVAALLLYLFAFSLAYQGLDAGVGALILFGTVQITMFAVAVTQRENIPWTRWVGAGLACLGLVWLLFPGAEGAVGDLTSMALMAAAGIGWGIYSLAGRHEPDALAATAANFVLSVPIALVLIQLLPMPASELPIQSLGIVLAIASGALTSGLGYALWYTILPRLGATRAATAQLSVPVIALAGGALILGEMPTLQFLVAALVVLGGVALSLRPTK